MIINWISCLGVITAGVSVPVQIPSQGPPDLGPNYWPRLQWSSFFGLPPLGKLLMNISLIVWDLTPY